METKSVDALERVARNLPVKQLTMDRIETIWGPVRYAYGQAGDGTVHGIYAVNLGIQDLARTLEFKPGTADGDVEAMLILEGGALLRAFLEGIPATESFNGGIQGH